MRHRQALKDSMHTLFEEFEREFQHGCAWLGAEGKHCWRVSELYVSCKPTIFVEGARRTASRKLEMLVDARRAKSPGCKLEDGCNLNTYTATDACRVTPRSRAKSCLLPFKPPGILLEGRYRAKTSVSVLTACASAAASWVCACRERVEGTHNVPS